MSEERFLAIYEALSQQGFGPLDGEVAKQLKFRPKAIKKLPMEKRAKRARANLLSARNTEMTYELFGSYLVKQHKELITGFLDATGVDHEDGMISDIDECKPDAEKIGPAIEELDGKYPADDVTLYLALSAEHWPDVPQVVDAWRTRQAPAAK